MNRCNICGEPYSNSVRHEIDFHPEVAKRGGWL